MPKKSDKFTSGRPILAIVLLLAYALGWLTILIAGAYFWSACEFVWTAGLALVTLWLPMTLAVFLASLKMVWSYSGRIRYLRSTQRKIPHSYIVLLIVLPVALFSIFWTMPIVSKVQQWTANSQTDSYAEFESYAKDCRVESIKYYSNNISRKSPDSDAYTQVEVSKLYNSDDRTFNFWSSSWLYYSYNQKNDLERIYKKYSVNCQKKTEVGRSDYSTHGDLPPKYKELNWAKTIEEYPVSC